MSFHKNTSTHTVGNTDFHQVKDWPEVLNEYDPIVLLDLAGTVNSSAVEYNLSTDDYVTTAGKRYKAAILNSVALKESLADVIYGIQETGEITVELTNVNDGINDTWDTIIASMTGTEDLRDFTATLWVRTTADGITFKARGKVTHYDLTNKLTISVDPREDGIFDTVLPLKTITAADFTATALDIGAPINICFGYCRNVPCYNIQNNTTSDYYDYLIGYGTIQSLRVDHANGYGVRRNGVLVAESEYTFYDGSQGSPHAGYAFIRFTTEQLDFNNSHMSITADVIGLEMGGTTAQRNGAEVLRNFLSNTTWGLSESVNIASFDAAATVLDPSTGSLPNIYIDGAITSQSKARDFVNELLDICRASIDRNKDGEWEITVDYAGRASSLTLNDNNFEIEKVTTTSTSDCLLSGEIRYLWAATESDAPAQKINLNIHTNFGYAGVFEYRFVAEDNTAKKILSYKYGREMYSEGSRNGLVIGYAGIEARKVNVNHIVTLTNTARSISAQTFVVQEKDHSPGDKPIKLTLRKYASDIYDDQTITAPTAIDEQQTTAYSIGDGTVYGDVIIATDGAFKTSATALNGAAGIIINQNGIYAGTALQTTANANIRILATGDAYFTGTVYATGGTFSGAISASTIDIGGADATSFHVDTNGNMWLGAASYASGPFRVSNSGAMVATSGSVGAFTINTHLYTGSKTAYNDSNAGVHVGSDGIGIGNNVFTVSSAGALVATSATITGTMQTSSSGQRVVLSSSANTLVFYNSSGQALVSITGSSGGYLTIGTTSSAAIAILARSGSNTAVEGTSVNGTAIKGTSTNATGGSFTGGTYGIYVTGSTYSIYAVGGVYITTNCSADSFTDRTPFFEGDALAEIRLIRGSKGEIDHSTLPVFTRRKYKHPVLNEKGEVTGYEERDGRDLGATASVLTVGMQQLAVIASENTTNIAANTASIESLIKRVEVLENAA